MSVNKVILIGNVGQELVLKYMPNGEAVVEFSLATNESFKDKAGVAQERTEWHSIVAYRRLAEVMSEFVRQGYQLYIEGRLTTDKWEKNGETRYKTKIVVNEYQSLGKRDPSSFPAPYAKPAAAPAAKSTATTLSSLAKPAATKPVSAPSAPVDNERNHRFDNFDDDIPFMRFPACDGLKFYDV